jgi:hypothetical protein
MWLRWGGPIAPKVTIATFRDGVPTSARGKRGRRTSSLRGLPRKWASILQLGPVTKRQMRNLGLPCVVAYPDRLESTNTSLQLLPTAKWICLTIRSVGLCCATNVKRNHRARFSFEWLSPSLTTRGGSSTRVMREVPTFSGLM